VPAINTKGLNIFSEGKIQLNTKIGDKKMPLL
jgi:hypothetical protein